MKQMIAVTLFFLLSNPAYGAKNGDDMSETKKVQEETQMAKAEDQVNKDRVPASDDSSEVSLTEQHYLIYE